MAAARPGSILEQMMNDFASKGWPVTDLARFRMEEPKPDDKPEPKPEPLPDDGKGGKEAVLADLAKERDRRQAVEVEREALAAQLKEIEDKGKDATTLLTEERDGLKGELTTTQRKALQYEVALDKGLPKTIAMRLQGDTQEAMEKDADELLKQLNPGKKTPSFDGGAMEAGHEGGGSFLAQALRNRRS